MEYKKCSNCSADLACGSQEETCWCMSYAALSKLDEEKDCLCETCLKEAIENSVSNEAVSEPDYYIENGLYVFTHSYHLKRGHCCKNGCRHCPYGYKK